MTIRVIRTAVAEYPDGSINDVGFMPTGYVATEITLNHKDADHLAVMVESGNLNYIRA